MQRSDAKPLVSRGVATASAVAFLKENVAAKNLKLQRIAAQLARPDVVRRAYQAVQLQGVAVDGRVLGHEVVL
jgi:hypothetical protein